MNTEQKRRERVAIGIEEECLTSLPDNRQRTGEFTDRLLSIMRTLAPSLPGPSGFFNPYGRVYVDNGHIELATIECDDPFLLPLMIERQHAIAAKAVAQLAAEGYLFVLANNNHSGLLSDGCPVWGTHESYLTEKKPRRLTQHILPFLVTRIYGGSGGIRHPSGAFVAGVRPLCMELETGGGTTGQRAIHSTSRDEHHMGGTRGLFRYHQIGGDGHRSHINIALQCGATALALKAVIYDKQLPHELQRLRQFPPRGNDWVGMLKRLNLLAKPGRRLKVDPLVTNTQRLYWAAACRYVMSLAERRPWMARILQLWSDTLDAMERCDRAWLAARLDSFAKYEFYSRVLQESRTSWRSLRNKQGLFASLALLDHSYHEFCNPNSVFRRLEHAGLLSHHVGGLTEPAAEPEPYIPETLTRARARARFIIEHRGDKNLMMDWSYVRDMSDGRRKQLHDPFAETFGPWEESSVDIPLELRRRLLRRAHPEP